MLPGEYARSGLKRGLELEAELGVEPVQVRPRRGESDTHTGLTTPDNDNFFGKFTAYEPNAHRSSTVAKSTIADGIAGALCLAIHHCGPDRRLGRGEHARRDL